MDQALCRVLFIHSFDHLCIIYMTILTINITIHFTIHNNNSVLNIIITGLWIPAIYKGQSISNTLVAIDCHYPEHVLTWEGYGNRRVSGSADLTLFGAISTLLVTNY